MEMNETWFQTQALGPCEGVVCKAALTILVCTPMDLYLLPAFTRPHALDLHWGLISLGKFLLPFKV